MATQLRRGLSLPLLTLYGLGSIVGAGIYVLVGEVAGKAGLQAPLAFLLAAVIAAFTGFSYAELAARYPRSAGEAAYVREAFGRRWLADMTGWAVVLTGIVSSATLARGITGYAALLLPMPQGAVSGTLIIMAFVVLLGLVACWGIVESAWSAAVMTLISVAGLLLVLSAAADSFATLPQRWPDVLPGFSLARWTGIVLGSFLAFYAFIGFEDMVNVAEEVRQPDRTMPAAILLALLIATLLYVAVATVAVLRVSPAELAGSQAPLVAIVGRDSWLSPTVIAALSAVAITNSVLPQLVMGSRVIYGLAVQGSAPAWFARINAMTQTPLAATLVIVGSVIFLAVLIPLVTLAKITSFIVLLIFAAVNASALWLKLSGRRAVATVDYPIWVSLCGALLCIFLLAFELVFAL